MKSETFKANVNERFEFDKLNPAELDIVRDGNGKFHILKNNKSFHAELIATDPASKKFAIKVNGNIYHVTLADMYDQLVKKMGLQAMVAQKVSEIKAPMPGLVLEVNVAPGQTVAKGDPILVLEAMKMENVIKSPGDGTVKLVHVSKGTPVEKGLVLIEME